MRCRSIRVFVDDGARRRVVSIALGHHRGVGVIDEVAWVELSPGMAREVAADLVAAADKAAAEAETP